MSLTTACRCFGHSRLQPPVGVVFRLLRLDRRRTRHEYNLVGLGQLQYLAGGEQRTRRLRAGYHQVAKPGREAVPCVVLHRTLLGSPPCGPIGVGVAIFATAPDRHRDGHDDRDKSARCRDYPALVKHMRCVGVIREPPPEQVVGPVDWLTEQSEPGFAEFGLIAERRSGPLRSRPDAEQDNKRDSQNLAPEYFCCRHGPAPIGFGSIRRVRRRLARRTGCQSMLGARSAMVAYSARSVPRRIRGCHSR